MFSKTYLARFVLVAVAIYSCDANAATVQVDIGRTGESQPEGGSWQEWLTDGNSFNTTGESLSFAYADATDGTLDASLNTTTAAGARNYGIDNVDQSGGALLLPDVWADLFFFNNNNSGSLTLTLNDLKAGTYQFTSYSYADNLAGNPGAGDSGIADVSVDTGSGFVDTALNITMGVHASPDLTSSAVSTLGKVSLTFNVENDGDPINIRYDGLATNGGDSFGINGFEIASFAAPGGGPSSVNVDLDGQDGPTQGGYTSWNPPHFDNSALNQSSTFDAAFATDGTVNVTMMTGGSTFERDYADVTGSLSGQSDLLTDLIFFNNDQSGSNFFQLEFGDLEAGDYQFTAYHLATNSLSGLATMDILLNGVDTGQDVTLQNSSSPASLTGISMIDFSVAKDGDLVTIRYANPTADHFGLNGFELIQVGAVVPEPQSIVLSFIGMIGLLALLYKRRTA